MKRVATVLLFAGLALIACGGTAEKSNETGNSAFAEQDYAAATEAYQEALAEQPDLVEPLYNLANVHYREEAYDQAEQAIRSALLGADESLVSDSHFNLGNSLYSVEKHAEAAEAYKEALRLKPDDLDAKYNLELALQQLQEDQQEQDQQEQDQQEQDQQEQDQQEQDQQNGQQGEEEQDQPQEGGQDEQESDAREGDESGQEAQDESEGEQESDEPQPGEQEGESQEEQDPEQSTPQVGEPGEQSEEPAQGGQAQMAEVDGLTEEQARQLLIAAAQGTETLQEHLQQIYVFPGNSVDEDW